jgi:SET domain-containing protein
VKTDLENVAIKESNIQGVGIFALKDFKKGEVILDYDDSDVVTDESKLSLRDHLYNLDYLANGRIVRMKEPERSRNHSCDPNSYDKNIDGIRRLVAMRDIKAGEEITGDQAMNGYNDGDYECHCGSENCREISQGNFFKLPRDIQVKYLPYLEDWFKNEHRDEIDLLLKSE